MTATNESTNIPKHLAELGQDEQGHHSVTSIRDLSIKEIEEIEMPMTSSSKPETRWPGSGRTTSSQ